MAGDTQNTCRHRFFFFLHFIRDEKAASEDSHPFYRAISSIKAHKKKGKKKLKVFLQLSCKDAYKAYKDAVDIFVVGKFLIS